LETARDFARHPPTEELVAFGLGEPVADRAALDRHLEYCPACTEQLELVRRSSLRQGEEDDSGTFHGRPVVVEKRERSRRWRTLAVAATIAALAATGAWLHTRWRLAESSVHSADQASHWKVLLDEAAGQAGHWKALLDQAHAEVDQARERADQLAERLAELTAQVDQLEARAREAAVPEPGGPRLGVVIVQAFSELALSRGTEPPGEELQEIPADADEVVLMLDPSDPRRSPPAGGYRIELSAADGGSPWGDELTDLAPGESYTVAVPGTFLTPGILTVEVVDPTAVPRKTIDRYRFRVVP
jgi:hypothetical protein